jgi:PP-loop superfamily ATP-utilizing enzyme
MKIDISMYNENVHNHTVVWSGGCDSTFLLYEVAKKFGTKGNPVTALSFDVPFINEHKKIQEDKAKTNILSFF